MKKMFGVAAAALLLSAGAASAAAKVIQISLLGQTCWINVITQADTAHNVYNKEFIVVNSKVTKHNCSVNGEGLLAKATFVRGDKSKETQNLAIISAYSPYLSYAGWTHATVTLSYPFVTGGSYTGYYYNADSNGNATSIYQIASGTYTVE
jgi:hypothetical protein